MDELDSIIRQINEEFGEETIATASETPRPQSSLDKEAFDDFNKRNPMAGGGMLVQPGFGGVRQGYAKDDKLPTKKNQIGKDDFINLVNQNKDKTYNELVEILKNYNAKKSRFDK